MMRIVFVSQHALPDVASGAAISLVEMLGGLREVGAGIEVQAICGATFDSQPAPAEAMGRAGFHRPPLRMSVSGIPTEVFRCRHRGIDCLIANSGFTASNPTPRQAWPYIAIADALLEQGRSSGRPVDVLITFGGGWAGRANLMLAKRHGCASVLWLRNHSYSRRDLLELADGIIVPSEYTARHYRETLGVDALVAHSPVSISRALAAEHEPRFVTFVSPIPEKGLYLLARIGSELGRRRPDIPLLIVLGRGGVDQLSLPGLDLRSRPNVYVMPPTREPREFLRHTKVMLAPSVWEETFFRTGIEAAINGIPTIGSDRGALPEVIGDGGVIIPVPNWQALFHRTASVADAAPWVDAIGRCFDDAAHYQQLREAAFGRARNFHHDRSIELHARELGRLVAGGGRSGLSVGEDGRMGLGDYLARLDETSLPQELHGQTRGLGGISSEGAEANGLIEKLTDPESFELPTAAAGRDDGAGIMTLDAYLGSIGR